MRPDIKTENRVMRIEVPTGARTFWRADKVLCQMASSRVRDGVLVCQMQAGLGGDVRQAGGEEGDSVRGQPRLSKTAGAGRCPPREGGPTVQ